MCAVPDYDFDLTLMDENSFNFCPLFFAARSFGCSKFRVSYTISSDSKYLECGDLDQIFAVSSRSLTWGVGPLNYLKCGSQMRVLLFIHQRQMTREILEHLKIYDAILL